MKRRYRRLVNFSSFGLLLFAVYLNFFKKDTSEPVTEQRPDSLPDLTAASQKSGKNSVTKKPAQNPGTK